MNWQQRFKWIGLCAVAECFGIGLAALWYGGVMLVLGEPQPIGARTGVWLLATLAAVPEGFVLGGLQALGLRSFLPDISARRFVTATIVVGLIGWGIGSFIPLFVFFDAAQAGAQQAAFDPTLAQTALFSAAFGAITGTLFGEVQACALPHSVARRWPWVVANAAGWAVALPLIYVTAQWGADMQASLPVRLLIWAFGGLLAGACVGAATSWAIVRLRA
ncbi:MAG: hypothetical protein ACRCV9_16105 [Burkholderiaceae bacterium]